MRDPSGGSGRANLWARLAPLIVLALALGAFIAFGAADGFRLEALLARRQAASAAIDASLPLSLAAFVLAFVAAVAASLPAASLLTFAGGLAFGGWLGWAASVVGATGGATVLFLAARFAAGAIAAPGSSATFARLRAGFHADAVSYLLFLRLVSVFPFCLVNLALAFSRVRLRTLVWTTFVGVMPATLAWALAGASLGAVADRTLRDYEACIAAAGSGACTLGVSPHDFVTREAIIAITALGVLALAPAILRRLRAAKGGKADV